MNPSIKNTRGKLLLPSAIGLLTIALVLAGAFFLRASFAFPDNLAEIAPTDSLAYVCLDLRPLMANSVAFAPTVKAWKASPQIARARDQIQKDLFAQKINLQQDIFPWVGPVMALVLFDLPEMAPTGAPPMAKSPHPSRFSAAKAPVMKRPPTFLGIFTTRDSSLAEKSLNSIAARNKMSVQKSSYSGFPLFHLLTAKKTPFLSYVVNDKFVLISNNPIRLKAAVNRMLGQGAKLSDLEAYKQVSSFSASNAAPALTYYINYPVLQKALESDPKFKMAASGQTEMWKYLDSAGGGLTITPQGLQLEELVWGRNQAADPIRKIIAALPPVKGDTFKFLPKDCAVALSLQSPAQYWRIAKTIFSAQSAPLPFDPFKMIAQTFQQYLHLDIDQDIFAWMTGEMDLGVFGLCFDQPTKATSSLPLDFVLALDGSNTVIVKQKLARLREAVQTAFNSNTGSNKPIWIEKTVGSNTYYTLSPMVAPIPLSQTQDGKVVLFSTSPEGLTNSLSANRAPAESFEASPLFQQAKPLLPANPIALFFAQPAAFAPAFGKHPAGQIFASIKSIAAGEELLPQGGRAIIHMELDYPGLITGIDKTMAAENARIQKLMPSQKAAPLPKSHRK